MTVEDAIRLLENRCMSIRKELKRRKWKVETDRTWNIGMLRGYEAAIRVLRMIEK